ncbi:MAG: DUF1932 domain-containing protein [Chloroflexota bacterium]
MTVHTVAIMGAGDMGHAVGRALKDSGLDVVTCLSGRSEHTRRLAADAGMREAPDLPALVGEADLFLSIMPPATAPQFAEEVAAAMGSAGKTPHYADCNAVSPATSRRIAAVVQAAGAGYTDAGIIGSAPGKGAPPRFYASGPDTSAIEELDGRGITVKPVGVEIGRASAIKMCYAALTKGTNALYVAVATAAESLGILPELGEEFAASQARVWESMRSAVPRMPTDAGRWIGEMEEITATFDAAGVTGKFHEGAADIFRLLDKTPFASETRQTLDTSRTLEEAVRVYVQHLSQGQPAAD